MSRKADLADHDKIYLVFKMYKTLSQAVQSHEVA